MTTKLSDVWLREEREVEALEQVPALPENSNVTDAPTEEAQRVVAAMHERITLAREYQDIAEEMLVVARETRAVQRRVIIEE